MPSHHNYIYFYPILGRFLLSAEPPLSMLPKVQPLPRLETEAPIRASVSG